MGGERERVQRAEEAAEKERAQRPEGVSEHSPPGPPGPPSPTTPHLWQVGQVGEVGQIRKSYGRGEQSEERKRTARGESAARGEHAAPGGSFRTQPTWPTWPTSLLMTHQLPHHPPRPRRSCEAAAHHVGANVAIRRITCLCDAREGATVRACVRERERRGQQLSPVAPSRSALSPHRTTLPPSPGTSPRPRPRYVETRAGI